uniref:Uncharacterized protein n=1 Tax=Parascaris equorum TaxID=6256 RepID=A0A914S8D7_PAREQ
MYDISIYGGDKTKLTRKERMRRRARRVIKAGLREDQYVTSNFFIIFIVLSCLLFILHGLKPIIVKSALEILTVSKEMVK